MDDEQRQGAGGADERDGSRGAEPRCARCGRFVAKASMTKLGALRPEIVAAARIGEASPEALLCRPCLAHARAAHFRERLEAERGALGELELEVARRAGEQGTIATNVDREFEASATPGQRAADVVARVGGSWGFVAAFLVVLAVWMAANSLVLAAGAFDPYPYILLNLVLSTLAAVQAPIILMSQNRAAERDRAQATQDYRVDLKAELEVAALHEKLDLLLHHKWESLLELQEAQTELLEETIERLERLEHRHAR